MMDYCFVFSSWSTNSTITGVPNALYLNKGGFAALHPQQHPHHQDAHAEWLTANPGAWAPELPARVPAETVGTKSPRSYNKLTSGRAAGRAAGTQAHAASFRWQQLRKAGRCLWELQQLFLPTTCHTSCSLPTYWLVRQPHSAYHKLSIFQSLYQISPNLFTLRLVLSLFLHPSWTHLESPGVFSEDCHCLNKSV